MNRQQVTPEHCAVDATQPNVGSREPSAAMRGTPLGLLLLSLALSAGGCAAPRHDVISNTPTTARPEPVATVAAPSGAIFRAVNYRPLFEDRAPRYVGDILTIQINEKLNASQSANSSTEKKSDVSATIPGVSGVLGMKINPLAVTGSTGNTFDGKGETTSTNLFTGTITVTVIEVLANGNLVVAGEKQIGIRRNSEVLKVTGVVNPAQIQPGNIVSSTQVADVRIDYRGGGYIEEAQIQGWLARVFNSVLPF